MMPTWDHYRQWLDLSPSATVPSCTPPPVSAWCTDTRTIKPGMWFVPIKGGSFDGHDYIGAAVTAGAGGFLYEIQAKDRIPPALLPLGLSVPDSLSAFQRIMRGWRLSLPKVRVVALTGSAGKTTTKEMVAAIFRKAAPTAATPASFNNEIGVPKSLQMIDPSHRFAVLEFGARTPGNISFLCDLARPDVAALINVGSAHLGVFGSHQALLNTKLEIFRDSPAHATLVANADSEEILAGARLTGKQLVTFGSRAGSHADVRVLEVQRVAGTQTVTLEAQGSVLKIMANTSHEMTSVNMAAAAAMALAAGVDTSCIVEGLSGFSGVAGRYKVHRIGAMDLIDDTYNANPDSMMAGLMSVAETYKGKSLTLVLGDMLELGNEGRAEHERIGTFCGGKMRPDRLVTVGPLCRYLAEAAVKAGLSGHQVNSYDSVDDLLRSGLIHSLSGDRPSVLYAKGSNSMGLGALVTHLTKEAAKR